MFAGAIIGGLASMVGYGVYRLYKERKRNNLPEVTNITVTTDDSTKVHKNYFDKLMDFLGTANDDIALTLVRDVVSFAINQKENSEEKVSLNALVKQALDNIISERKYRNIKTYVDENKNRENLAYHITKYFITKNPLKDAEVGRVERKDVEKSYIYESMLSSYASKGLSSYDLQNKMATRKQLCLRIYGEVHAFLDAHKNQAIKKLTVKNNFEKKEGDIAWSYVKKNKKTLEERFNVNIVVQNKSTTGTGGEKGNTEYYDNLFIFSSKETTEKDLFYNTTAKIRKDHKVCIILKGSVIRKKHSNSFQNRAHIKLFSDLLNNKVIVEKENGYVFTSDYVFANTRLSTVAGLVCGTPITCYKAWKNIDTNELLQK